MKAVVSIFEFFKMRHENSKRVFWGKGKKKPKVISLWFFFRNNTITVWLYFWLKFFHPLVH